MKSKLESLALQATFCIAFLSGNISAEEPPVLRASGVLQPELVRGQHFITDEAIQTKGLLNRYSIRSDVGEFEALGNQELLHRIREISAIAQLQEVSRSREFAQALKSNAADTVGQTFHLILEPGKSIGEVFSGAGKSVKRATETIHRGLKKTGAEKEQAMLLHSVLAAKRTLAAQLGVDPYSTNQVLQDELTRVARPIAMAGLTVNAATFVVPASGALTAFKAVKRTDDLSDKITEIDPIDLHRSNRERLETMGVNEEVAKRFLDEAWLPPTYQYQLLVLIDGFRGATPEQKTALVARAADSQNEIDAGFFARVFVLLALFEESSGETLTDLQVVNGFPSGRTANGRFVFPLDIDLLSWGEPASANLAKFTSQPAPGGHVLMIGGRATAQAKTELANAGVILVENCFPGIYRDDWAP